MKVRSHILLRFKDLKKNKGLVEYQSESDEKFRYKFNSKVELLVNSLEHEHIQKQLLKGSM